VAPDDEVATNVDYDYGVCQTAVVVNRRVRLSKNDSFGKLIEGKWPKREA
jgi:hypothetical protein